MRDEEKGATAGIPVNGQGLFVADKSLINVDTKDVTNVGIELAQAQAVLQRKQQQPQGPQGPVVCWEQFLPVRSLKVLLVENDDSTRHVVSALLRNCSYEVTAVANGLEAWKILQDLTNHIDFVLTEVAMPYLSGIGLLSKIVRHKTCNNIPVIMMSSNDSMGIVFKCLSKGAVDFLVKPIRKNELKNLWQHVWRKCHSSSGSGSESCIQTQKSVKSKNTEGSENNTGSNDEDDNGSIGLNGSDNGSGTQGNGPLTHQSVYGQEFHIKQRNKDIKDCAQPDSVFVQAYSWYTSKETLWVSKGLNFYVQRSTQKIMQFHEPLLKDTLVKSSWSKKAAEVDSPQPMLPWDQLADPPDSTCAQFISLMPEAFSNNWVPRADKVDCHKQDNALANAAMGKDLEIGVPGNSDLQIEDPRKRALNSMAGTNKDKFSDLDLKRDCETPEKMKLEFNTEVPNHELRNEAADFTVSIVNGTIHHVKSVAAAVPNNLSKTTNMKDKATCDIEEMDFLDLGLKRPRDVGYNGTSTGKCNVLRHSAGLSAFSRYNTFSTANQAPTGNVCCCSPLDNSSEAAKTESAHNLQFRSTGTPNHSSNGSSNNNDMGSTTNGIFTKPEAFSDKPIPKSMGKVDATTVNTVLTQARAMHQQVQVQHHHHHYHHHHHHVHNMQQQQQLPKNDDLSSRNMVAAAPHCGASNMLDTQIEGNAANYGSASGSNSRSNGQNGSSTAVMAEGVNVANDDGVAENCGAVSGSGSGSRSGVDQNCFSQREAALTKFRQKRKERCFEKKVRYQSRKRLAEQRPRVRGQFVRHAVNEDTTQGI
ncbi:unnamed protein product [Ilex paraguariensis]